jgi:Sulfatase
MRPRGIDGARERRFMNESAVEVATSQALPAARSRWHDEARAFVDLFALSGIAIAQPMLDLLSKNTGVFVSAGTTPVQLLLLVGAILFVLPTAAWLAEMFVGAVAPPARRWFHGALCGVFVATVALESVKKATSLSSSRLIIMAVAAGVVAAALVSFVTLVREFLRVLAVAPLVFAFLFVAASPATRVVFDTKTSAATGAVAVHPHRVVVVVVDAFPEESLLDGSGHVDAELFPNIARFASDSTWYRNETTVAPWTQNAVPAILTGMYPKDSRAIPTSADYPRNLFTLLGGPYVVNAHESVTRLCPSNVCATSGSSGGLGGLVSQSVHLWQKYASPKRTTASLTDSAAAMGIAISPTEEFMQSLRPSKDPRLDFVHIVSPHQPWHLLPTLQDTENTALAPGSEYFSWTDPNLAAAGRERHLLQVQALDKLLGRLFSRLKQIDAYKDSMIVLTADHGASFASGQPTRAATDANYAQIMWPPLFIKYPDQTSGTIDDRPAQSVDILPTIADVVGAKIGYSIDGRSLLGAPRTEGSRPLIQWYPKFLAGAAESVGDTPLEFDGKSGFAQVLSARAATPSGDPALRVYRDAGGDYGALLGQTIGPRERDEPGPLSVYVSGRPELQKVDPAAHVASWAYHVGYVYNTHVSMPMAIGIDGKIVAVARTASLAKGKATFVFTFVLPPQLVRPGRNDLTVYAIHGSPSAPTFDPIPFRDG